MDRFELLAPVQEAEPQVEPRSRGSVRITVDLPEHVNARLQQIAGETDQTRSAVVRTSINLMAVILRKMGQGYTELSLRNPNGDAVEIPLEFTGF